MFSNKEPTIQYLLLGLIITLLVLPSRCDTLVHISKSTNCTITFATPTPNNSNAGISFLNCTRHSCQRNLVNGNCANVQKF